jgi:cysteine desulfurase
MLNSSAERRIYLDFNASTPVAPEVADAMRAVAAEPYGTPTSHHWAGHPAKFALEKARTQVAELLGCKPDEVVFTSGGSEANNHALKGVFFAKGQAKVHFITTQVEHPSIIKPCAFLERLGATVTYLPVDGYGRVDPDDVRRAITMETVLISVMHANSEVGTFQPIAEIARIAREHDILFHTDAAQSVGKVATHVGELGVDLLSVVGHKLYGRKGVGALFVREHVRLEPLIHGGGHEMGRRAGTENILLDVGLGTACETAHPWLGMESARQLRDLFWNLLQDAFGDQIVLSGHPTERLPNTLNVSFIGRAGSEILGRMENIAASTGSACHSGSVELSPVLKAMNVPPHIGMGAIRFSLGRTTTREEIESTVALLTKAVPECHALA